MNVKNQGNENFLTCRILNDSNDILKYLQIGINIPIWAEFHEYILSDLNSFNAKAILLEESGNPAGITLIYSDNEEILYFGYFGVINHGENKIYFLLDELIKYARDRNFKIIRGPINIPTVIYGWGFMQKGSLENLFVGKPVNPPIYQAIFIEKGFYKKMEELSWEGTIFRINPYKLQKFDYSDYELFHPKDLNEFMNLKDVFLTINAENLPETAKITPNISNLFENYVNYLFKYGYNFMIMLIRYKPTNEIVACGSCLPNPFRKDKKGNYNSIVAYSWAVKPEHRKKGLAMLMYGETSLQSWKKKLKYTSGPTGGTENIQLPEFAKISGLENKRTHIILEFKL